MQSNQDLVSNDMRYKRERIYPDKNLYGFFLELNRLAHSLNV
jgi:hypothetical protein